MQKENLHKVSDSVLLRELAAHETNHILHLLLTIVTGGMWAIVWIIVGLINGSMRQAINNELDSRNLVRTA